MQQLQNVVWPEAHTFTLLHRTATPSQRGYRGLLGLIFAGYVPVASQRPYPIIVFSVANYRPHLNHFWANM